MRKFFLLLVVFFVSNSIIAQSQSVTPAGEATYQQISLWDTEKTSKLLFTANESIYYYGRTADGSELNNKVKKDDSHYEIDLGDREGWTYYKNIKNDEVISRDNIWTKFFIVKETLPILNWKIGTATKKIGNYDCQKAECTFRGRDFEAWFAASVPVSLGPWKLWGLPGLIIEAYDTNREFKFILTTLDIPAKTTVKINPPTDGKLVTHKEFLAIYDKKMKAIVNSLKVKSNPNATGTLSATVNNHSIEQP